MTTNIDSYFENGNGFKSNPFRKGYLSNEERKQPMRYYAENFVFFSKTADLSEPLEIYRNIERALPDVYYKGWEDALLHDYFNFIVWWLDNVHKHLNGFSGIDGIKIEVDPELGLTFINLYPLQGTVSQR